MMKKLDNSTGLQKRNRHSDLLSKDNCQDYTRERMSPNVTHIPRTLLSTGANENFNILSYGIKHTVQFIS